MTRGTHSPDFEHNAAHYDQVAEQYDTQMGLHPSDMLARQAFVELVAHHVSSPSTLLDFGCGTGLDALEYIRHGHSVQAYDHSAGMMARLEQRCQAEIASGKITHHSLGYAAFLKDFPWSPLPHAVVSNFAVLNLIPDLDPLFDVFARHLAPPGWAVVSILNPIHWTRLRSSQRCQAGPYASYLHSVNDVLRAARRFHLVGRANAGAFVRYDRLAAGEPRRLWWSDAYSNDRQLRRLAWHTAAHKLLGRFVFLVLRRDP